MRNYLWICLVLLGIGQPARRAAAQVAGVDALHYVFELTLSDETDRVEGETTLTMRFTRADVAAFPLNLVAPPRPTEAGMRVEAVLEDGRPIRFNQIEDRLLLTLSSPSEAGEERVYTVTYAGTPADGLIVSRNRHGNRTFFGDNWPNRARHWLPTIDHPSDKATCEFVVRAPAGYQVIANGRLVEETDLPGGMRLTHWKTEAPLPTKVMVFGAARFAVRHEGEYENVPIQTWVYPEDRDAGFHDFGVTLDMLRFFEQRIGPFPYEKLANVQSKTRYGGMENAGAIFYNENAITGERTNEVTVAHEIAHQWFGDSVTEADWPHIWLSEGFATYFAELYFEHTRGQERLKEGMAEARAAVLGFYRRNAGAPLVNPRPTDPNEHLNTNSYQKGAWVLHMLRGLVGDDAFWAGIRAYYATYRDANATSADLQRVMEQASGKELGWFFQQWLYRPGHPKVAVRWTYDAGAGRVEVTVSQTQREAPFRFPLTLSLGSATNARREIVEISSASERFSFAVSGPIDRIEVDPDVALLLDQDL